MPFTYDENGALLINDLSGSTFIGLTDTPAAYAGNASRVLAVNVTPDAVLFANGLYWIDATGRLGINTNAPTARLQIDDATHFLRFYETDGTVNKRMYGWAAVTDELRLTARNDAGATVRNLVIYEHDGNIILAPSTGNVGIRADPADRRLHVVQDDAGTAAIIPVTRIESRVTGGAGAAGHGAGFEYTGETSTTENTLMTVTAARWSVATHASRRARFELRNYYIGNEVLCGVIEAPATASADGNSRGVGAVDLQGYRSGVAQVAAAPYSALIAGQQNEIASNSDASIIVGGYDHSIGATALYSGILAGYDHSIDGADYAGIMGGREGSLSNYGQITRASGMFANAGDAQSSDYVSRIDRATHVVNTWYSLYLDGTSEQMVIPASSGWTFDALVVGITANAAQQWSYKIVGLIERDNAGNTTLAASTTTTVFESDANYDAQAVADNVNEALEIQVRRTGGVDYSVQWVATIRVVECYHV